MVSGLLNAQTNLLWQWRSRLVELLAKGVGPESGEDADGKEYARSLETQGEAETFLDAYSVLLNDRREALFAEKSLLAAHDGGKFGRPTAAAIRAAGGDPDAEVEEEEVLREAWPEDQILRRDLMEQRKGLLVPFQGRALKSIMVDLANLSANKLIMVDLENLSADDLEELQSAAADAASLLRDLISSQGGSSFFAIDG